MSTSHLEHRAFNMEAWWGLVVHLMASGKHGEAILVTQRAAEAGSVAARVRLAMFGEEAGVSDGEAGRIVEAAERIAGDDVTLHWALRGAHELLLGECDYEEKSRRVLRHLEAYAVLSEDVQAVFAVAMNYLAGRIGVPGDHAVALDWLYCAAALGHERAQEMVSWHVAPGASIERNHPGALRRSRRT
ncbi:hypothetical protein [Piscinibacter gummiphilus]|uniref:hypothetical protein n=1 Tax=Piscinibacter gummiphilus TaxID=946333 RepID=UPI0012F49BFF|nr:hypothetical protein [Piscinibacter gummiphilus]